MAVSLIAGAIPVTNVSSANNDPRVYVDITYDDNGKARADIMFENLPNIASGGFHIEIGDGWKVRMSDRMPSEIDTSRAGCTSGEVNCTPFLKKYGNNDVFLTFSLMNDYDLNGRFFSIYLEKSDNFNSNNSEINVVFQSTANVSDCIATRTGRCVIDSVSDHSPTMLEAYEYLVGDVNNDGRVNAIDSTLIRCALEDNKKSQFIVNDIKKTYKSFFPDAVCPASPDANQNGTISLLDADLILDYYADMSTDGINNSRIGKLDFYELFDD